MIGLDELTRRFAELDRAELGRWIENRWVLPEQRDAGGARGEPGGDSHGDPRGDPSRDRWVFHEVDIARVELILDIRREFAVDDEVMPLVLSLLDQVYSLRRQMRRLCDALESQPADIRNAIRQALPKE